MCTSTELPYWTEWMKEIWKRQRQIEKTHEKNVLQTKYAPHTLKMNKWVEPMYSLILNYFDQWTEVLTITIITFKLMDWEVCLMHRIHGRVWIQARFTIHVRCIRVHYFCCFQTKFLHSSICACVSVYKSLSSFL